MATSPFALYANATLTFSVPDSGVTTDPATGNVIPNVKAFKLTALLKPGSIPRALYRPGTDEGEEQLEGYAVNPMNLPPSVGHLSKATAIIRNPTTGKTQTGYFILYRGVASPYNVEAYTGSKLYGTFRTIAQGL